MADSLEASDAEGAEILVLPSSQLQPIRGPYSVLKEEPNEEFAFGRRPNLPNSRWKRGDYAALELQLIG
jgi:hypothetical protein